MQTIRMTTLLLAALLGGCAGGGYSRMGAPVEGRDAPGVLPAVVGSGASSRQTSRPSGAEGGAVSTPLQVEAAPVPRPLASGQPPAAMPGTGGAVIAMLDSTPPPVTPAVDTLLAQARLQWQAGDLPQAVATVERALRIEPYSPYLWQHLAALRLAQQRPELAAQFAAKSNSFAGGQRQLLLRNWRIIAEALRQRGDASGARDAEARAASYAGGAD